METLLKVSHLSRHYGTLRAVEDLHFTVQRGQIIGFLGVNGAGKSTTMQMLAGTLAPTTGYIEINGYDLLKYPSQAKQGLGYLPENPPLYREMLVQDYLHFCARLHGLNHQAAKTALQHVLHLCGLETVYKRLIGNLSKGYQQRIGIAQAIIHNPPLVILDEPTVGLDPLQIVEIRQLIRALGEQHSVILSTHLLAEVQTICNIVNIIHQGRLVLNQPLNALLTQTPTRLRVGLKTPPPLETLRQLPGVSEANQLDTQLFSLTHAVDVNPTAMLVTQAVVEGWGLYLLMPEQQTLEQIFIEVTLTEKK